MGNKNEKAPETWARAVPILSVIIFLLPAIVIRKGPLLSYVIVVGLIGYSVGKESLKFFCGEYNRINALRGIFLLFYLLVYISAYVFVGLMFSSFSIAGDELLSSLFWLIVGSWFFYTGLISLKTKEYWNRNFKFTGPSAVFWAILELIFSLVLLFLPLVRRFLFS